MDKKLYNTYKQAHKDMINWLLNEYNIEIGATPDDYLNHLMIEEDKTNVPQFYPIPDRLYYFCAFAYQIALEQNDLPEQNHCKYCPFKLINNRALYNKQSCDYWTELPHDIKWARKDNKDLKHWKKLMREFRDKPWDDQWVDD